jgi:AcrR family transcriptional regulator
MTGAQATGRPRDAAIDEAVLLATVELLERDGYLQLTIANVAARAGTSKPAIYRRWPTKAHLVHEAVFPAQDFDALPPAPDLRAVVRTLVDVALELLGRPAARAALPGLLAETSADMALANEVLGRAAGATFEWLERQLANGDMRAGVSARDVFDVVVGAAFMAVVASNGRRIDKKWRDAIVAIVLEGIAA